MAEVLGTLVAAIRMLTVAVAPIIPGSADKLLTLIDSGQGRRARSPSRQPIFPRLELAEDEEAA